MSDDAWPGQVATAPEPQQQWPGQEAQSPQWSEAAKPLVNSSYVGTVMRAFGETFRGETRTSMGSEAAQKFFDGLGDDNPIKTFRDGVLVNTATMLAGKATTPLDAITSGIPALYHATQEALVQAGVHRDIVSIPDAFAGSPHPTGMFKQPTFGELTRDLPKGMPEGLPVVTEAPKQSPAAKAGSYIDAYHGSPHDFEKFDVSKIGTGEGAQAYGHGLYFAESESVASHYRLLAEAPGPMPPEVISAVKHGLGNLGFDTPGQAMAAIRSDGSGWLKKWDVDPARDPAEAKAVDVINKYIEENQRGNLYNVRINADPDKFLDWDKPLSEQPAILEAIKSAVPEQGAIRKFLDEVATGGMNEIRRDLATNPEKTGATAYSALGRLLGGQTKASELLRAAGIKGIKYLDGGSRAAGDGSRNYVVFDHSDVEITHKNGLPTTLIGDAKDAGVIGPDKPPISTAADLPKDRPLTMQATGPKGEAVTQEVGGAEDAWWQRYRQSVGKLDTPQSIKDLLVESAKDNDGFVQARQGNISLGQIEDIAQAAGVDPSEINASGVGRTLTNDLSVHRAMQWMLDSTERMQQAAQEVRNDGSPENLAKLQESIMRRDLAVEQIVGLRAEWGRTGNAFQKFMTQIKEEQGLTDFLKDNGRSPDDLRNLADGLANLDPSQAARMANDLRTPGAWDKFRYYWINSLISGPTTHAKYIIANAAFQAYESAVVTPLAGTVGTVRRALGNAGEGVFMGEGPARLWGLVAGVPDAVKASIQAAKTGMQTPLPGEVAQNIIPKNNRNLPFQQKPIGGTLGTVIGLPSRGASAIHSFFNFLGYRASIEAQAYRQAAKEGLKPADEAFWQRREAAAATPSTDMMNNAIEEGYRGTYINELGPASRKLSQFVNSTKLGQMVMPFVHIPMNILQRALDGTPAAFLSADTRDALLGRSGAVKQDMAVARLMAGSAVGAWAVNQVLNDRMTGYGPTDQKERAQWLATGHQPYSVRIGDEWVSFNRFGSIGTMLGLYTNLADAVPHIMGTAEEGKLAEAMGQTTHAMGRLMEDEVGMQGLGNLMQAIEDPKRYGSRYVSQFAGSLLPFSSAQRQVASAMDPNMREAKTLVDGLRYYVPDMRQGLEPKRDWLGQPIANAGYGGDLSVPGLSAIIQHRDATTDPLAAEMQALNLRPAAPQDRIRGVKLPPELYDKYQATAGPFLKQSLETYMNQPGWHDLSPEVRRELFQSTIKAVRQQAGAAVQMEHPEIIQQAVKDRMDRINGVKPGKLKY